MPFRAKYKLGTGGVLRRHGPYTVKSGETITMGMICKLTSGEIEPADTSNTLSGFSCDDYAAGDEDAWLYDIDTVMEISDTNARVRGAALDIDTGSQSVTTDSNSDLVNVESTSATEKSLVMIHPTASDLYKA